jgi:prepilin-type N-terminal cleavage/methylation domain-containing protein
MVRKYTILKVLIQNSSKVRNPNRGFTLIELIFGLLIMVLVGGFALGAFIEASATFSKDKKSIDSSQSISAVLEVIGNDIRQSGEQVGDSSFPAIEFTLVTASEPTLMLGSSKVTIRRALTIPLNLCQTITAGTAATSHTTLAVADSTITTNASCNVGTSTTQLFAARPGTTYTLTPAMAVPSPALALILPGPLRQVRDHRCQLDDLNPAVPYDSPANATTDFCGSPTPGQEIVRLAMSDRNGHILVFNGTGEVDNSTGAIRKYDLSVNAGGLDLITTANNTKNQAVEYPIGSPIYVIEERVYSLDNQGSLQVSVDGRTPSTLIKKIARFNVSAKGFTNATDQIIDPTPGVPVADICTPAPTTPTVDTPQYICKLNYNALVTDPAMNWKMIAGVKVEIQSKYDATGRSTTASTEDIKKLSAKAEFFPRNVLSK